MPPSAANEIARRSAGDHPDTSLLNDFANGRLDDTESAGIELHLEDCDRCCAALSNLSAHRDQFVRELVNAVNSETDDGVQDGTPPVASMSCQPPAMVGRFEVREEIGRGGFGVVLLAWDTTLRRDVALKVPRMGAFLSAEMRERFLREAQAAAALDHSHIVPIYEAGQDGETCFIAAAHCRGPNLDDWLKERHEPVPVRTAAWLVSILADAVQHAHSRGVLHRDLKPSNVLLEPVERSVPNGERSSLSGSSIRMPGTDIDFSFTPKLTDFGLAKLLGDGPDSTHSDVVMGTAAYMSPEQASGQAKSVGPPADVYSLGAVLYQLLTGQPPLVGETELETILRVQNDDPIPPARLRPRLPQDLETICLKCLEKDPQRRYATAEELADDLNRSLRGDPILARRTRWPGHAWRWCRRNPLPAGLCALSGLLLFVLVAGSIFSSIRLNEQHEATLMQLGETRAAEARAVEQGRESRRQLFNSLVVQSRARRLSGRMGQKFENMQSLKQAATLAPELDLSADDLRSLRSEVIATMALTDLRIDREWPGYPPGSSISGIAFDAEVERYAMIDEDGAIVVRNVADNALLTRIDTDPPHSRNVDWRLNLRFSPDGRYLAGGQTETPPHEYEIPTRVWDLTTSEMVIVVPGLAPRFSTFDFDRHSETFAAARRDGLIVVFDIASQTTLRTLEIGTGMPRMLRFSPNGDRIAVCHGRNTTIMSSESDGDRNVIEHSAPVLSVAWDSSGQRIATGGSDDRAYIWNAATGARLVTFREHFNDVIHTAFAPDDRQVVTTSWVDSRIWDAETGRQVLAAPGSAGSFSRNGRWLEFGYEVSTVGRWEVAPPEGYRLISISPEARFSALDVSPDGRLLLTTQQNQLLLWNLQTGQPLGSITLPHVGATLRARFHPSGSIITSSRAGLHVWPLRPIAPPVSAAQPLALQLGPPEPVPLTVEREFTGLSVSRDGRILVSDGFESHLVRLESHPPAQCEQSFRQGGYAMAASSDERWLATSSFHGYETRIWDVFSRRRVATIPGRSALLSFSPDNRQLWISTAEGCSVRDVGSWQERHSIPGDSYGVAFSPDGRLFAIVLDGVTQLRDAQTYDEIATFTAPAAGRVTGLAFSPDGAHLAVVAMTGAIHVWDLQDIHRRLRELGLSWTDDVSLPQLDSARQRPIEMTVDLGEFHEIESLTTSVETKSRNPDLYFRRGQAWMRFRQWANALSDFSVAVELDDEYVDARFQRGVAQLRLGQVVEAAETFGHVIEIAPDRADAHLQRGYAHRRQGEWTGAIADFTRVIQLRPEDWQAWLERGIARCQIELWDEAVTDFTRVIELAPDDHIRSRAFTWRGIAFYQATCFADALQDGENALAADAESWSSYNNLAWALSTCPDQQLQDPDRAVVLAKKSIDLYRQNGMTWNTLGVAYFRQGESVKSREAFEESMSLRSGGDSFDWFFLAMLDWQDGDPDSARNWMQRAIDWMESKAADDSELRMFREEAQQLINFQ